MRPLRRYAEVSNYWNGRWSEGWWRVHCKDNARRWNTVCDVNTLVIQPRQQRKQERKAVTKERGTGSFGELQWRLNDQTCSGLFPGSIRICNTPMNLPVGTPSQKLLLLHPLSQISGGWKVGGTRLCTQSLLVIW